MVMQKHIVYLFRSAPYDSPTAQEGLDSLLAAAAFEQHVSVLFMDDGVFQLLPEQSPHLQRNHAKMLQALALYEVERCFVHAPSLARRGQAVASCIGISPLDDTGVTSLLRSADHTLSF